MPRVLITGAAGFIGQLLTKRLLNDPQYQLVLTDIIEPNIPPKCRYPQNATPIQGDLNDESSLKDLISSSQPLDAAFLFHGIMSSGAEADFELGMRVNMHATAALLEALRQHAGGSSASSARPVRVIYASSQAVYGQPLPAVLSERVVATPESSYGAQKLACETLVNEYTRRGFVDGLVLRFPTISVRPGRPTAAASSFLSGIIREPLAGKPCVIPLVDRAFPSNLASPATLVLNLVHALSLDLEAGRDSAGGGALLLLPHRRVVNLPGITVTIQEMMDALAAVGGRDKLSLLSEAPDPATERILRSWGFNFDHSLALKLGFMRDTSFEQVVRDYKASLQD